MSEPQRGRPELPTSAPKPKPTATVTLVSPTSPPPPGSVVRPPSTSRSPTRRVPEASSPPQTDSPLRSLSPSKKPPPAPKKKASSSSLTTSTSTSESPSLPKTDQPLKKPITASSPPLSGGVPKGTPTAFSTSPTTPPLPGAKLQDGPPRSMSPSLKPIVLPPSTMQKQAGSPTPTKERAQSPPPPPSRLPPSKLDTSSSPSVVGQGTDKPPAPEQTKPPVKTSSLVATSPTTKVPTPTASTSSKEPSQLELSGKTLASKSSSDSLTKASTTPLPPSRPPALPPSPTGIIPPSVRLPEPTPSGWYNNCTACNGAKTKHTCCFICRNYDEIDAAAMKIRLDDLSMSISGPTAMEFLKAQIPRAKDAGPKLVAAKANVSAAIDAYNKAEQAHIDGGETQNKLADDLTKASSERVAAEKACDNPPKGASAEAIAKLSKAVEAAKLKETRAEEAFDAAEKETVRLGELKKAAKLEHERALKAETEASKRKIDAETLEADAVREIARILLSRAKIDTDPISRARFFFTWIATTVRYSKDVDKPGHHRSPAATLVNRIEVCEGYAKLFKVMFDTHPTSGLYSPADRCDLVTGWARKNCEDYVELSKRDERGHEWNRFPYPDPVGGKKSWKVIDVTWGSGAVGDLETAKEKVVNFDPTWFTKEDGEFSRTHLNDKDVEGPSGPQRAEEWWLHALPEFSGDSQGYHIDKMTLRPEQYRLPWTGKWTFAYGKACEHILTERMPTCGLLIYKKPRPTAILRSLKPFVRGSRGGQDVWVAEVDLSNYETADTVELHAIFEPRRGPCDKTSGLSLATSKTPSSFINGVPVSAPLTEILREPPPGTTREIRLGASLVVTWAKLTEDGKWKK